MILLPLKVFIYYEYTDKYILFVQLLCIVVNPWASNANLNKSTDEDKNDERGEENGEEEVDNSHDPHFEPIIALPDAIEVSTGEENEKICKRFIANLFTIHTMYFF